MKKQIFKNALLLLLAYSITCNTYAQTKSAWLSINYDRLNHSNRGEDNDNESYQNSLEERMERAAEASSAMSNIAGESAAHLRIRTTEAPPDCPECTPDPGGGVVDVPFDKNLLIILFAASAFVIRKVYK